MKMFCITLDPNHYEIIKRFGYIPVGLGNKYFNNNWFSDKSGINISEKNKNYGEYTFHYWLWKNYFDKLDDGWIGFCQYRKFWSLEKHDINNINFNNLKTQVLKEIPNIFDKYDSILGEESSVNRFKPMKFIKRGFKLLLKNPLFLFDKNKRNIKFHFNLWHGSDYLKKAIGFLDNNNRSDFSNFINTKTSFNPHNMFICKSKKILNNYYTTVFPWLRRCEREFGLENLSGYGQTRIYGFLAERFMSYWFQKNTKFTTMPIVYYDIGKD